MKSRRAYLWLGLVAAFSFVLVGASDCDTKEQGDNPQETVAIGQVFHATDDGWDIVVTTADAKSSGSGATDVAVRVKATNTGTSAHSLGPNRFKLHDASGRTWKDQTYEVAGGLVELTLQKTQPGLATQIDLSFLVPADAKGLWLETIGDGHIALGDLNSLLGFEPGHQGAFTSGTDGTQHASGYVTGTDSPPSAEQATNPTSAPTPPPALSPTPPPVPTPIPTPCTTPSSYLTWVPRNGCAIDLEYTAHPEEGCRVHFYLPLGLPYGYVAWKGTQITGYFTPDDPNYEWIIRPYILGDSTDWCKEQ